jgi:hypothetical protein
MSTKSALLLKERGLLDAVDSYVLAPDHPKAEPPVGVVDLKQCIEDYLDALARSAGGPTDAPDSRKTAPVPGKG